MHHSSQAKLLTGNELCGGGILVGVSAADYAVDITTLSDMMHRVYKDIEPKPLIIAPGGFSARYPTDKIWYTELLNKTHNTLDAVSHHIYDLGDAFDEDLTTKILDPSHLDNGNEPYEVLNSMLKNTASLASPWVTESGGTYHGGQANVTDAFVFSFWFLDQLGKSSVYNTKTYCRQSLLGGNYGLLQTITYEPNPDYYSALLFHRLMGSKVLSTSFEGTKKIRAYSHCAKESKGITILLINLDNSTCIIDVNLSAYNTRHTKMSGTRKQIREEYRLTAKDGNLHSKVMLLNGEELSVDSSGDIPLLTPLYVNSSEPITVAPYSIVFVHLPHFTVYACQSV
ncbi:heparanase-like protein 3 [Tanacetum coccineum]